MDERDPAAAAAYIKRWSPDAGYDLDAYGEAARLADAAGVNRSTFNRLINGIRVPDAPTLFFIAEAIGRPPLELLVESGTVPRRFLDQAGGGRVASRPVTADALADEWGVDDLEGRAFVRDSLDRLRRLAQQQVRGDQDTGS